MRRMGNSVLVAQVPCGVYNDTYTSKVFPSTCLDTHIHTGFLGVAGRGYSLKSVDGLSNKSTTIIK